MSVIDPPIQRARRGKWYLPLIGWDDACCSANSGGIVSYRTVPFALILERTRDGGEGFLERSDSHRPMVWAFLTFGLIGAIPVPIVLMDLANDIPIGIPMLLWVFVIWPLLVSWGLAMWRRRVTTARRLVFLPDKLELAIQTVRSSGEVESEARAAISECKLRLCKLKLWTKMASFEGWIVHVVVADRRIALACVKRKEDAIAYMHGLPGWLLAIDAGEGEPVSGQLFNRHFGNTPRSGGSRA